MEIVVFAFIAAAVIAWQIYSRQRRTDECEQWALANGFQFAGNNPCGLDELVFGLFRRGHSHKWRNVMIGRADGENLALADFQYTEGSGKHAHTSTYSVAVMHLPAFVPWVEIKGESLLTSLAGAVGFDDVQFESGEFNDRFLVRSADREFAYKLIDARMMEWLMITGLPISKSLVRTLWSRSHDSTWLTSTPSRATSVASSRTFLGSCSRITGRTADRWASSSSSRW